MPDRLRPLLEDAGQIEKDRQQHRDREDRDNHPPGLGITPVRHERAMPQGKEMRREIEAGNQHEDDQHPLDRRRIESCDVGVMGRVAAQRHGRKAVADRLVPVHAGNAQTHDAQRRGAGIDQPEIVGGLGDARGELGLFHRARRLGAKQLHAAHTQQRQDGNRHHDDPHAADPLQQMAPDIDRLRQGVEPDQQGGAGGGQRRDGLEKGIGEGQAGDFETQRQGGGRRQGDPGDDDKQTAVAGLQVALAPQGRRPQRKPDNEGRGRGDQEAFERAVLRQQ